MPIVFNNCRRPWHDQIVYSVQQMGKWVILIAQELRNF